MKSIIGKLCDFHDGAMIVPTSITTALSILLKRVNPQRQDIARLSASILSLEKVQPIRSLEPEKDASHSRIIDLNQPHILQYGQRESAAYMSLRFLPSFVAINAILQQLTQRLPHFEPKSFLDYGCGPGTAIWYVFVNSIHFNQTQRAMRNVYPSVKHVLGIDISERMLELVKEMQGISLIIEPNEFID